MAVAARHRVPTGSAQPRVAPPLPLKTWDAEYAAVAALTGKTLLPWQAITSKYMMARSGDHWQFPEVCIVAARQNGKTTLLIPRILWALQRGRRILHTAQNRSLPREVFDEVASLIDPKLLKRKIRFGNGQEKITLRNGGSYRIIAPQRGARGLSADDLIIDELREFEDYDFIHAAMPTLTAGVDRQVIYLSNAGWEESVVLNDLRDSESDQLAYLEWSADPDLDAGDEVAWVQANPGLGHLPAMYGFLQQMFESKPSAYFETEHLCRWVPSLVPALVTDFAWRNCQAETLEASLRPYLGVSLDPSGKRASAAIAWKQSDGSYAYQPILEVSDGVAIDVDALGTQLRSESMRRHVKASGYSGLSDIALARYLPHAETVDGQKFANASASFATLVEGRQLRWVDADALTDDLRYTVRRQMQAGAWSATRSQDDRPITASLAAIRAVWLASEPRRAIPRIG